MSERSTNVSCCAAHRVSASLILTIHFVFCLFLSFVFVVKCVKNQINVQHGNKCHCFPFSMASFNLSHPPGLPVLAWLGAGTITTSMWSHIRHWPKQTETYFPLLAHWILQNYCVNPLRDIRAQRWHENRTKSKIILYTNKKGKKKRTPLSLTLSVTPEASR